MRVAHNGCVLVADGRKLMFLRNEGDAEFPDLKVETAQEHFNPADHDHKRDRSGSAPNNNAQGGGTMGETDFHQLEADRFASEAADIINRRALNNEFEELIVVAPPRTLGELRQHYHKETERRIVGELAKDLTNHPVDAIEKALSAAE